MVVFAILPPVFLLRWVVRLLVRPDLRGDSKFRAGRRTGHYSFAIFNADAVDLSGKISILIDHTDAERGLDAKPHLLCGPRTTDIVEEWVPLPCNSPNGNLPTSEGPGPVGYRIHCRRIPAMSTWVVLCEAPLAMSDVRMRVWVDQDLRLEISGRNRTKQGSERGLPPLVVMILVGLLPLAGLLFREQTVPQAFDFVLIGIFVVVAIAMNWLIRQRAPRTVMGYVGWDSPQYRDRRGAFKE